MASRQDEKEQLRNERIAREQAEAAAAARKQRLYLGLGAVAVAVAAAVVIVIVASSSHKRITAPIPTPTNGTTTTGVSPEAEATIARVKALLADIPQSSDNVLGKASAPVSIIEYGDLECSVCDMLALPSSVYASNGEAGTGIEDQIITNLVKTGKAKLIYRSLETATSSGVTPQEFVPQQAAAYAAGMQNKAWDYIELFYNEQGQEGSNYVNDAYLENLARQVPGLNVTQWKADLDSASLKTQISQENASGTKYAIEGGAEGASTPTLVVQGPKGTRIAAIGIPQGGYAQVAEAVAAVS